MRYWMQDTRSNSSSSFSVLNVEVAKTATSFFTFQGTYSYSDPSTYKYNT